MRTYIRRRENKNKTTYQAIVEFCENGKRKRKSKTFDKKKDAEEFLKNAIKKYDNNTSVLTKSNTLFNNLIDEVNEVHFQKIKPSTARRYSFFAKKIKKYFVGYKIKDIIPKKIEEFYTFILENPSKRSDANPYSEVEKIHKYLNIIFMYAVKWGYCITNICKTVSPPKKKQKEIEWWTEEEIKIFLGTIKNDKIYYPPIFFALNTGCRIGEVCGLRWQDIDFKNNIIKIRKQRNDKKELVDPKTSAAIRNVPMFLQTKKLLLDIYKENDNNPDDFVFKTTRGEPFTPINLTKSFTYRVEKCVKEYPEVKKITFHGLRHTFVTHMVLKHNIPLYYVSKIIGHEKVSTTSNIYFHLKEDVALDMFKNIQTIA